MTVIKDPEVRQRVLDAAGDALPPHELRQLEREISPERTWSVPCHMQVNARTAEEAIEMVVPFTTGQAVIVRFSKPLADDEVKDAAMNMVGALGPGYGGAAQVLVWVNCDALENEVTVL